MSFDLLIEDAAVQDASEIHLWYEQQRRGLGDRFLAALDECYEYIHANPRGWQVRRGPFRYAQIEGFPLYRVVYALDDSRITVYQVRHTSRRPDPTFGP